MTKQTAYGEGGPDPKPVHERVGELIKEAYANKEAPVEVLLSTEGHSRALYETVPGMDPWSGPSDAEPTTFLGFPFRVVRDQEQVVLLRCVPGGSAEARESRASRRAAQPSTLGGYQAYRARTVLAEPGTLELLGRVATAGQVRSFVRAWLDADCQKWGDFEKALDAAVGGE